MNDEKAQVAITLLSKVDGEQQTRHYQGEWFRKGETIYLRYEETDEVHGQLRTLVRWRNGELQLTRRGAVESEQFFVAGTRRTGRYRSAHTRFIMETETKQLRIQSGLPLSSSDEQKRGQDSQERLLLELEWGYTMWVNEEETGRFEVLLRAHQTELEN